jgi:hypothetical protein
MSLRKLLAKTIGRSAPFRDGLTRSRRLNRQSRPLVFESLEDRTVPSILFSNALTTQITDNRGPVITNDHLELIFWGYGWTANNTNFNFANSVESGVDEILPSPYLDSLSQYRPNIGSGFRVETVFVTNSDPPSTFTGVDVDNMLRANMATGGLPDPATDSQLLYMVITQPNTSLVGLEGAHTADTFNGTVFHFGFLENGANPSPRQLDELTTVFSHELVESVSDPEPLSGICIGTNELADGEPQSYRYRLNGALVQSYFSQQDLAFIVPTGQAQDFVVSNTGVLTVNGDQLFNPDDTIVIDLSSAGGIQATLNGDVAQFEPGAITGINVASGEGFDTINVLRTTSSAPLTIASSGTATVNLGNAGSVQGIQGSVSVENPPSFTTLNVDDSADSAARMVTLDTFTPPGDTTFGRITGLAPATISYECADISSLSLSTGSGGATVNVHSTCAPITLFGNSLNTTVNVGNAGSVQGIVGDLTVENPPSFTTLNVDDSLDATARTVTLDTFMPTGDGPFGRITGLAPATINYEYLDTSSLSVSTGGFHSTLNVLSTGVPTKLFGYDYNTVNVGDAGSVQGILGDLTVENTPSFTTLNVDDSADSSVRTVTLDTFTPMGDTTFGRITGLAPVTINYEYDDITGLTVSTGSGGTTVNVEKTAPQLYIGPQLTLNLGSGADIVNLSPAAHSLANIQGDVTINGHDGINSTLNVHDEGNPATVTYTLTANTLQRTGSALIHYSGLSDLTMDAGANREVIRVQGTAAGTTTTFNAGIVYGGMYNDIVVGGTPQLLDAIHGALAIHDRPGNSVRLDIDDGMNSVGRNYTIVTNMVQWDGSPGVSFNIIDNILLDAGHGSDEVNVNALPAGGVPITLHGGDGYNKLFGPNTANTWSSFGLPSQSVGVLNRQLVFEGFGELIAGIMSDNFVFDNGTGFSGSISGRGGVTTLDYSAYTSNVIVNLPLQHGTGVGGDLWDIQNVIGGHGGPAGSYNILVGDVHSRVLTGGNGRRNLLIAGPHASMLQGGDGEDILIAGTTDWDTNLAALQDIMSIWAGGGTFLERRHRLVFDSSYAFSLNPGSVHSNGGHNTLTGKPPGSTALDLYFANPDPPYLDMIDANNDALELILIT